MHIKKRTSLELHNSGDLELYFIGTGSAFSKTRNQNNLMIIKGNEHLLVDCGSNCSQALHDAGVKTAGTRNFLITHSHADHIGGLEEYQLFNRYVSGQKPAMIINEEYQEILWNQSLRGGSERAETTALGFEDLWDVIRPEEISGMPRETWESGTGGIHLMLPRTMHFPDDAASWQDSAWSCAVIIDKRVLFTSDTRYDPALLMDYDRLLDFELIFHDCQLFTGGVHASLEELSALPTGLKSKMILMHYGDNWREFEQQSLDYGFQAWAKQGYSYCFD